MKITYFGYHFKPFRKVERKLTSISKFLKAFCAYDDHKYKNSFKYFDDNLYLLHHSGNLFMFIASKDANLIKRINAEGKSVGDLQSLLAADEKIGFASYVYIGDYHIAFASQLHAPRHATFVEFFNKILYSLNDRTHKMILVPLMRSATRADALSLDFIGESAIQVDSANGVWQNIVETFGGDAADYIDVDSFTIVMKPKRGRNIKTPVINMLNNVKDEGLDKLVLRAKDEESGTLQDMYIRGNGGLSDIIDARDESQLEAKIVQAIEANAILSQKISEFENAEGSSKQNIECIAGHSINNAWPATFGNLQNNNAAVLAAAVEVGR